MAENLAPLLARISEQLVEVRAACGQIERNQSDPEDVTQALSDIAGSYSLIAQMAEVLNVARNELLIFREWREARMSGPELKEQLTNLQFVITQLTGILQGQASNQIQMRSDIRRLAALQDVALSQMPTDEEPSRVPDDVREVLIARRTSRQRMNAILIALLAARHLNEAPPDLSDELHALAAADSATLAALERAVAEYDRAA